jgi:glycerol-3-phosphate dehydrogenase
VFFLWPRKNCRYTPASFAHLAQEYKVPHRRGHCNIDVAQHLANSYGDQAAKVTAIAQEEGLGRRLVPWHDVIEAEVVYAARYVPLEMYDLCFQAQFTLGVMEKFNTSLLLCIAARI